MRTKTYESMIRGITFQFKKSCLKQVNLILVELNKFQLYNAREKMKVRFYKIQTINFVS